MNTNDSTGTVISSPITKSATVVAAAVGANTDATGQVLENAAANIAIKFGGADWFWFIVQLPWGAIASMLAAMYTLAMFSEWIYKKPVTWLLVKFRFKKEDKKLTATEWAALYQKEE